MGTLNCRIRRALPQDSEELVSLGDETICLDDRSRRDSMLKESFRDPSCSIYVAEVDGAIAGFTELRVFPDFVEGAPIAMIQNLAVKKTHRRLGIGTKLVERAVEDAGKRNAAEIHVWTEFDNKAAIRLYAKNGFERRALLLERGLE